MPGGSKELGDGGVRGRLLRDIILCYGAWGIVGAMRVGKHDVADGCFDALPPGGRAISESGSAHPGIPCILGCGKTPVLFSSGF